MGDTIGGRPDKTKHRNCYNEDGLVDYEVFKVQDFFLKGIERLKIAYEKEINAVIMCSESKPCECHRSKLIGRVLQTEKVFLKHIDEKGKIKDQTTVISELNKGKAEINLFGELQNVTSRKAYI